MSATTEAVVYMLKIRDDEIAELRALLRRAELAADRCAVCLSDDKSESDERIRHDLGCELAAALGDGS